MSENSRNPNLASGFIYILSNPSMHSIYKVGFTTNSVRQRIQELNSTGVPKSFELVKKYEIREDKLRSVEQLAHRKLKANELHHGKEFFEGPLSLIEAAVEDSIYAITGETAIDLVGDAIKRKAAKERKSREEREANERKVSEEREFERSVQDRLTKENQKVDELRLGYIIDKNKEAKENNSFVDTYIWIPLGFLFAGVMGFAILSTGPIGWLIVVFAGWWLYAQEHVKPQEQLKEDAQRRYPYKISAEMASLLKSESSSAKNTSSSITGSKPPSTTSSISSISQTSKSQPPSKLVESLAVSKILDNKKFLDALRKRISSEVEGSAKKDPGLWFECYQKTKNLSKRGQLYQVIREEYLMKKIVNLKLIFGTSSWDSAIDQIPHLSSYTIDEEIQKRHLP
jgi:hypothetical protein